MHNPDSYNHSVKCDIIHPEVIKSLESSAISPIRLLCLQPNNVSVVVAFSQPGSVVFV